MILVKKAQLALMAGVSRPAIGQAIDSGRLVEEADGRLDIDHPVNALYLDEHGSDRNIPPEGKRGPKLKKNPSEPKTKNNPPAKSKEPSPTETLKIILPKEAQPTPPAATPSPGPRVIDEVKLPKTRGARASDGGLYVKKLEAEIRYRNEQADAVLQKRLERLGELIERGIVRRVLGKLGAALKLRLLDMPRRIAPRLQAMTKSGMGEADLIAFMEAETAALLREVKETIGELVAENESDGDIEPGSAKT